MNIINVSKGFSLTEVIVAVIIASVLMSVAIPRFTGTVERIRAGEGVHILMDLLRAQKAHKMDTGVYTAALANLDVDFPNSENFGTPVNLGLGNVGGIGNPIGLVQRDPDNYTLTIDEFGTIGCIDAIGPIKCVNAGY